MKFKKLISCLDNYNHSSKINLFYLIICLLFVFISVPSSSYLFYYWPDFIFAEYFHNLNLEKEIFDVLPNTYNANGITSWILEPKLNFLSHLNYNLSSKEDYFLYLFIFRLLEISTIILLIKSFNKKITINDTVLALLIYSILIVNFTRYDHESYISFSIIIFCLFHALANNFKNNYLFFLLIFIGNFWSFFINPIFFFNVCFFPLIFFYSYFLSKRKYKKFFLVFLGNLPFVIFFIFLSLGNSRFILSDLYPLTDFHYNFSLFRSKNFLFVTIIFFILSISNMFNGNKNSFFEKNFIAITFFQVFLGSIYFYKTEIWKLPQPEYLEYSFQYILILIMFNIIKNENSNRIFIFCLISILVLLFNYRLFNYIKNYNNLTTHEDKLVFLDEKYGSEKKYFWQKINDPFLFEDNLKNKKILLDIPNYGSKFHKSYTSGDLDDVGKYLFNHYWYNDNFKGSFLNVFFWKSKIIINEGYSHYLDINTVLSNLFNFESIQFFNEQYNKNYNLNFTSDKILKRHEVPKINYDSPLLKFLQFEYVLSDQILDKKLIKTFSFKEFDLYLYRINSKNENKLNKIENINVINNYNNYKKNLNKLKSELFVSKENFLKVSNIKKFCDIKIKNTKYEISFFVNTEDDNCIALFPIAFSNNNYFLEKNSDKNSDKKICPTFEAQYFFHACILNKDSTYILKKNNSLLFPIGSVKDLMDFKKKNYNLFLK